MEPTDKNDLIEAIRRLVDLARRAPTHERCHYITTASWLLGKADKSGARAADLLELRSSIHELSPALEAA